MRTIDLQTWSRREHFKVFNGFDHPHFNMCANVDLTAFYPAIKQVGVSFTIAIIYAITRTANAVPEFRYRIRPEGVVEHDLVHPSATILVDDDLFTFCHFEYTTDFTAFAVDAAKQIEHFKAHPTLANKPGRDDSLYLTAIPWVTFTSFMHPLHLSPPDSVPRFAWGKRFEEGNALKMPLSVQGHHAVMDGIHMGKFYGILQELLDQPQVMLGET